MKQLFVEIAALLCVTHVSAQEGLVPVKVRAILVDKDLNPKPVPKLVVKLVGAGDSAAAQPKSLTTGFDGLAEAQLTPGRYHLTTPQPAEFQGKKYSWELDWDVVPPESHLDLSIDNAKVTAGELVAANPADNLRAQFQRLKNSVVTVESESGRGTGFFVDSSGIALTNAHVVGDSDYLAVQFDADRKVIAKLLVSDPQSDIAVLWVNLAPFPEAVAAPVGVGNGRVAVAEGDLIFTIGSPLDLEKILTTGVVSKVDTHAIISDINVNPGNSGGPLFTTNGDAVGITAYREHAREGPGITGIVRIEDALPLLEQARSKTAGSSAPSAALLPVDPKDPYPADALKALFSTKKAPKQPYKTGAGDYEVLLWTPPISFLSEEAEAIEVQRQKDKHAKKNADELVAATPSLPPGWEKAAAHTKPVLEIVVKPKLSEDWTSRLLRAADAYASAYSHTYNPNSLPPRLHYKADFYRMRLLCGDKEVQPIRPGKTHVNGVWTDKVHIRNTATFGDYFYSADSISPECGKVTVEIYANRESDQATTIKIVEPEKIEHVLDDFAAYRKTQPVKPVEHAPNQPDKNRDQEP